MPRPKEAVSPPPPSHSSRPQRRVTVASFDNDLEFNHDFTEKAVFVLKLKGNIGEKRVFGGGKLFTVFPLRKFGRLCGYIYP